MKYIILAILASLATIEVVSGAAPYDFDGDGKTDFAVVRPDESSAPGTTLYTWYVYRSADQTMQVQRWGYSETGVADDFFAPADYDGDGKTDFAVARRSSQVGLTNTYYILNSATNTVRYEQFGKNTDDPAFFGDYDGDGKADIGVFRRNAIGTQGQFIYKGSLNNPSGAATYVTWGDSNFAQYFPCRGDFDGDGKLDPCVRYVAVGQTNLFVFRRSSDGGVEYVNWGLINDIFVSGDFDGDGRTDFCVRRTNGTNFEWYILERDGGGTGGNPIVWGLNTDASVGGYDFDGDGKGDITVYRSSGNTFFTRRSINGAMLAFRWGTAGDRVSYRE